MTRAKKASVGTRPGEDRTIGDETAVTERQAAAIVPQRSGLVVPAAAIGAIAVGAFALGAVAVGAVAVGRLAVRTAHIRRLEIDELVVRDRGEAR